MVFTVIKTTRNSLNNNEQLINKLILQAKEEVIKNSFLNTKDEVVYYFNFKELNNELFAYVKLMDRFFISKAD